MWPLAADGVAMVIRGPLWGEIFIYYQILTAAVRMLDAGKIRRTQKSPSILTTQSVEL